MFSNKLYKKLSRETKHVYLTSRKGHREKIKSVNHMKNTWNFLHDYIQRFQIGNNLFVTLSGDVHLRQTYLNLPEESKKVKKQNFAFYV